MGKSIRKSVTIPQMLFGSVVTRFEEFGYTGFSPYAVELVCFDIRTGSPHTITLQISRDPLPAQDAVDRELVRHYKPGAEKAGLLVTFLDRLKGLHIEPPPSDGKAAEPACNAKHERITFSSSIWPIVDLRWRDLGYASLSAYITGLVRYDLMIGGPHLFTAADIQPEIQAALDKETIAAHLEGRRSKTYLDYMIERAHGKAYSEEETSVVKEQIALLLRKSAGKY